MGKTLLSDKTIFLSASELEPHIYRARDEHPKHYTTDVVFFTFNYLVLVCHCLLLMNFFSNANTVKT
jgi:hypothetical protein